MPALAKGENISSTKLFSYVHPVETRDDSALTWTIAFALVKTSYGFVKTKGRSVVDCCLKRVLCVLKELAIQFSF